MKKNIFIMILVKKYITTIFYKILKFLFLFKVMDDDTLARLISMPNTIVTSHQAFFTEEALKTIAESIVQSLLEFFSSSQTNGVQS